MIKSNATKSIIIIDDDIVILNSLKIILKNLDYDISYFNNSNEALNEILKKDFDIIITDIEMPTMSGIEIINKIKNIKRINKIILMSSNVERHKTNIENICDAYINKPFKKEDIINLLG